MELIEKEKQGIVKMHSVIDRSGPQIQEVLDIFVNNFRKSADTSGKFTGNPIFVSNSGAKLVYRDYQSSRDVPFSEPNFTQEQIDKISNVMKIENISDFFSSGT